MSSTTRVRGTRLSIELDEELTRAIDEARKLFRLKRRDYIRLTLARHLLGTLSLSAIAV